MSASVDELVAMIIFGRVVEAQSFTGAAAKLGLSKSAVSARVADLEAKLGMKLLNRTTRRLSLTEAGLEVYGRCARMIAEADAASAVAEDLSRTVGGILKINAPQSLSRLYLADLFHRFLIKHPALRIDLTVENRFVDVLHDGYDLVLRIASAGRMQNSMVAARKLAKDELIVVASPAYLAARGTPTEPQDLVGHSCPRYSVADSMQQWSYVLNGKPGTVPVTGQLGTNDADVLVQSAVAGAGLVIGPSLMFGEALRAGSLVRVLEHVRFSEVGVYALYADRKHIPAKLRATVDYLATELPKAMAVQPASD